MDSKDAKFFNVSEKHEMDMVCRKYEDPEAVKNFIREKAKEGVIKYWTHEKLYEFLEQNGFKQIPPARKVSTDALVAGIAEKSGLSKAESAKFLSAFLDTIKEALMAGDSLTLKDFGTFKVADQAARKGRNPRTGEDMDIPAKKAIKFTAGKALKEAVDGK